MADLLIKERRQVRETAIGDESVESAGRAASDEYLVATLVDQAWNEGLQLTGGVLCSSSCRAGVGVCLGERDHRSPRLGLGAPPSIRSAVSSRKLSRSGSGAVRGG